MSNISDNIQEMLSEEEISRRVRELGVEITRDYAGREITIICILKGAAFFACELAKRIELPVMMEFMSVSSYGDATVSSGEITIRKDVDADIAGRDVLIVEDIIDTGRTLSCLVEVLGKRAPASIRLCTLLDKPSRRTVGIKADYTGFEIPDEFVVGWGLDCAQRYRNLPYIAKIVRDE